MKPTIKRQRRGAANRGDQSRESEQISQKIHARVAFGKKSGKISDKEIQGASRARADNAARRQAAVTLDFDSVSPAVPAASVDSSPVELDAIESVIASHFDVEYYAYEYPELDLKPENLLRHYCRQGWYEGRNPNAFFDTCTYLDQHGDVERVGLNPYYHYLVYGHQESRIVAPSVSASIRTRLLFGHPITDVLSRLRPHVDLDYYSAQIGAVRPRDFDPVAHFAYRGWREGKSPNPNFNTLTWLDHYPLAQRYLVNPLLIQLEADADRFDLESLIEAAIVNVATEPVAESIIEIREIAQITESEEISVSEVESPPEEAEQKPVQTSDPSSDHMAMIASEFSHSYYLATYPDVAAASINPLVHYFHTGWREGRNPNEDFDTKYYLDVNEDVRDAGLNPLWHYLVSGKAEGRLPRRPGGYRRQLIDNAIVPALREPFVSDYGDDIINRSEFIEKIKAALDASRGLVVSLSHDCYLRVIGGTQIFISDEQQKFNASEYSYLHISPQVIRMTLAERTPDFLARVALNGTLLGLVPMQSIVDFFAKNRGTFGFDTYMVVHCLLGFHVGDVLALKTAVRPTRSVYWLHDYSSLCEGFNLLRNDVQFCGAPPPQSAACRVCVYGADRQKHLAKLHLLFKYLEFEIASPSHFTLGLWERSTNLPYKDAFVHPHWALKARTTPVGIDEPAAAHRPVSVAFVGFPSPGKGWQLFCELVRRFKEDSRYKFFHFAAGGVASLPGVEFVVTEVTPENRSAAKDALERHEIDLVVVLSPWPETFSFVTFEALAAGACIVCLEDSGNVADVIRQLKRGAVLSGRDEMIAYFESGAVTDLVKMQGAKLAYEIQNVGTSATIAGMTSDVEQSS